MYASISAVCCIRSRSTSGLLSRRRLLGSQVTGFIARAGRERSQSAGEGTILAKKIPAGLKRKVAKLANEPALHFFELAQALAELHEANAAAFASLPVVKGMGRRRIYYLLQAGKLLQNKGISRETAEAIGWTKLQIIARHLNQPGEPSPFTVAQLLQFASDHTARDLPGALRGQRLVRRRIVPFYLNGGARAELDETLIKYGAKQVGKRMTGREAALIRLVRADRNKSAD